MARDRTEANPRQAWFERMTAAVIATDSAHERDCEVLMSIATSNNLVYERPVGFTETPTHYCPGCTHGVAHRLVAEVLEEMGVLERTIGVAPVGCAVFAYNYFDTDFVEAPHGRAPAMATGIKRVLPDRVVFTYQGDGDLASIGMGEIVHAAARGENISVIFINNANYGMTGGQMAPTTLPGMKTTSSPNGRDVETQGYPIRMCEMLSTLGRRGICGAPFPARPQEHSIGQESHTPGVRDASSWARLLDGGAAFDVPHQLEHDACRVAQVR